MRPRKPALHGGGIAALPVRVHHVELAKRQPRERAEGPQPFARGRRGEPLRFVQHERNAGPLQHLSRAGLHARAAAQQCDLLARFCEPQAQLPHMTLDPADRLHLRRVDEHRLRLAAHGAAPEGASSREIDRLSMRNSTRSASPRRSIGNTTSAVTGASARYCCKPRSPPPFGSTAKSNDTFPERVLLASGFAGRERDQVGAPARRARTGSAPDRPARRRCEPALTRDWSSRTSNCTR